MVTWLACTHQVPAGEGPGLLQVCSRHYQAFHQLERVLQDFINVGPAVPGKDLSLRAGVEYGAGDWDIAWHLQGDIRPDQQTCGDHRVGVGDEL